MYEWTSEAVAAGHPDKVADQIADGILDAHLERDPQARVACEVIVTRPQKDLVILTGEITSKAAFEHERVACDVLRKIGYDRVENGCNCNTATINNYIRTQSPEIAGAVVKDDGELGAGDQGLMFGYACNETKNLMPLAHSVAFNMIDLLEQDMKSKRGAGEGLQEWGSIFLPDAKTQATIVYNDKGQPVRVSSLVVSVCHKEEATLDEVRSKVMQLVPQLDAFSDYFNSDTNYIINPAGEWNLGGPAADTGLSGRKIVVDNYGADCPIGGGSFSGKDPTKVDRSAAYAARQLAKAFVRGGFADKARVQLSYAIGVVEPVSVRVETFGTGKHAFDDQLLTEMAKKIDLSPAGIIKRLRLREPLTFGGYLSSAAGGHFGRPQFPWEQTEDILEELK
jgi:S-adenosylmethionine synthetase